MKERAEQFPPRWRSCSGGRRSWPSGKGGCGRHERPRPRGSKLLKRVKSIRGCLMTRPSATSIILSFQNFGSHCYTFPASNQCSPAPSNSRMSLPGQLISKPTP